VSLSARFRRSSAQSPTEATDDPVGRPQGGGIDGPADERASGRSGARAVLAAVVTALAGLFVFLALVAPNDAGRLTPGTLLRIPLEGLLVAALVLALPPRARRVAAALVGVVLGLVVILKIIDMGFFMVLARPFHPVFDWTFLRAGVEFLAGSYGRAGAIGVVVAVLLAAVAVLAVMTLSALRLSRVAVAHRTAARRAVTLLTVAWVGCAAFGVRVAPDVPVAADSAAVLAYDRTQQVRAGLRDREVFAAGVTDDDFDDAPGELLLTGLRGKDVVISFVESYGRTAVEHPEIAPRIDALLDDGTRRLRAAGYDSRSAFLTSPTAGGGSWLAHATLLSGVWADNQQRYVDLMASDRLTLNGAFRRAGWRSVIVMPALTRDWPEGEFFDSDQIIGPDQLGYRGPKFGFAPMPDQYTLSVFQRTEREAVDRAPVMAEIALVTSHAPWKPTPRLVDWNAVGDGTIFGPMVDEENDEDSEDSALPDPRQVRAEYQASVASSLESLISYVETYGDEDLVLVFLGDHQPAPAVTGPDAGWDVPITIVAKDPDVLERISGWGWQDGLNPDPRAPVWPMDAFRDRFLRTF
jgi:hypothetical protein